MPVSPWRSLRVRLISSVVIIEIVMLSLLVWSNIGLLQQAYADRLRDSADSMLKQVATTTGGYLIAIDYASLEEYLRNIADNDELSYLAIFDRDERSVVKLGDMPDTPWPALDEHPLQVSDGIFDVAAPILIGDQLLGQVRMGLSLTQMNAAIHTARVNSVAIAGTEITLTILATVFIGLRLTRRLGRLANAAQQVGAGDYTTTVATEIDDEVGKTAAAFNHMVSEVSERTRRMQNLLARERVIEETSIDGMVTYGDDLIILSQNPAITSLFGYAGRALIGQPVTCLLSDENWEGSHWKQPTPTRTELTGLRKDTTEFPLELFIGRVDLDGKPLYAATLHDISERKLKEHECMTLLEGNRFLVHKSLAVQEEERRYLARELHDELGQCLTAIQADARIIHDRSGDADSHLKASAQAILTLSSRIYDVVHSMMQRLRPVVLDDLGLIAAIEEEVNAWQQRYKTVDLQFNVDGDVSALEETINISVYRIVQEALTNISKHSEATRVTIELAKQECDDTACLLLKIEDNGGGMDPGQRNRGLGLLGMRERIEAINGSFSIHSEPGKGLRLQARVPLPEYETA
ncbi:ATP-binding protein [Pseudomonadota bacterium]